MDNETQQPYISDASKPSAGRIYDYFLKRNHNFLIDREMAKQILKAVPDASEMAQFIRWFIGEAVMRLSKMGYTQFIDFASGLPTVNHIHTTAPEGTKVIYSDIDPITVRYSKKNIGDNPLVKYETCDAATPEILLESDTVKELLGKDRKVVFGMNGICDTYVFSGICIIRDSKFSIIFISGGIIDLSQKADVMFIQVHEVAGDFFQIGFLSLVPNPKINLFVISPFSS